MVSDAHAHLDPIQYKEGLDKVIDRASAAGLEWIINVAMMGEGEDESLAITAGHDFMRAIVGCHPHDADKLDDSMLARLEELAKRPDVVGIGELGLDFFRNYSPVADQEKAMAAQLDLARRLDMSIAIHDRDAHDRTLEILKAHGNFEGMFHCFSGDIDLARQVLDMGLYISIPGVVTFPKAKDTQEVAAFTPLDRLLVETDCPFLAPVPNRGKRNEPAYVIETAKKVAEIKGLTYEQVAQATTANLVRLFNLEI